MILERVKKDLPPVIDINIDDVVEYIWEALSKIGALPTYITLYSILEVDNYRAKLPSWLHVLKEVRYLTNIVPNQINDNTINNLDVTSYRMSQSLDSFDLSTNRNNIDNSTSYQYIIKDNYIHTTFKLGLIEICYEAMPIDTDGYPLIPDNVYFIEAVSWYIIKGYLWRLMIRDTSYMKIFQYAESQWNYYCNSAANSAKIPNRDGLQSLIDKFLRIIPNLHRNVKYTYYRQPNLTKLEFNNFIKPTYNGS